MLDLIFTNEKDMITDLKHTPGLGSSNHESLCFTLLNCYYPAIKNTRCKFNLHLADFDEMCQKIESINWKDVLCSLDKNQAWDLFACHFDRILKEYVPFVSSRYKKNIYMMNHALNLKNKKYKLWRAYATQNH